MKVGIDLVCVDSVRESVSEHAERYLDRVYTRRELDDCADATGVDSRRLAARFAAKEATIKALGPGPDQAVPWRDVDVRRQSDGTVGIELSGSAATLARERGLEELAVSLTHEGDMAAAVVVAR